MKGLNYDLKNLCQRMPEGAHATRAARFQILQQAAGHLHELGYKLPSARSLKPKHVHALVGRWKAEGISTGAAKNRLAALRWWAEKVGKASVMTDNEAYGLGTRESFTGNRAQKLDLEKLKCIPCSHVRMAVRLQAAFGLRREEALKFRPSWADGGNHIRLKASWCKGGRPREIPVLTERQRALLNEASDLAKGGSLIPEGMSYIRQLRRYSHLTLAAGFQNLHGLRHGYAQARYKRITGWDCPTAGGPKAHEMTPGQRAKDYEARLTVSRELGHNRIEITHIYLGGRK